MDWHDWIRKHEQNGYEIAKDFVSTVDFEHRRGMDATSYYYPHGGDNTIPEIPVGKKLCVRYYFEDDDNSVFFSE